MSITLKFEVKSVGKIVYNETEVVEFSKALLRVASEQPTEERPPFTNALISAYKKGGIEPALEVLVRGALREEFQDSIIKKFNKECNSKMSPLSVEFTPHD